MTMSWKERERGYPQLAAYIAADEDKSIAIYRRFERLAARNLLYLESELAELEEKQDELDRQSRQADDGIAAERNLQQLSTLAIGLEAKLKEYAKKTEKEKEKKMPDTVSERPEKTEIVNEGPEVANIPETRRDKTTPLGTKRSPLKTTLGADGPETTDVISPAKLVGGAQTAAIDKEKLEIQKESELKDKVMERLKVAAAIRRALKEYYEALKLESEILSLKNPSRRVLKDFRKDCNGEERNLTGDWFARYSPLFKGTPMEKRLRDGRDLCVLAPPVERDRLTKFLEGPFSIFFRGDAKDGGEGFVSHKKVDATVSFISMLAAILFLLGALWGLYAVADAAAQMIMLSAFTISFGGALGFLTNARRQDVFAATAAYTAVLVVFISTNMASTWGTAPPPAEIALTVTLLETGTNSPSLNLTATTMLPSADQASGPSLQSPSSHIGFGIALSFAALTILIVIMVWLWKVYHANPTRPESSQDGSPVAGPTKGVPTKSGTNLV